MNDRLPKGGRILPGLPPVLEVLLLLNVGIFLVLSLLGTEVTMRVFDVAALLPWGFGFFPTQLITYQFLHGGFTHVLFNMIVLWSFGSTMESLFGSKRFIVYYLLCGIGAGLFQLVSNAITNDVSPLVGASGSIYGVMMAFILTFPDQRILVFPFFFPVKAKWFGVGMLVMALLGLFFNTGIMAESRVAHIAHIGGAAAGFLLLRFGKRLIDILAGTSKQSSPPKQHSPLTVVDAQYRDSSIPRDDDEITRKTPTPFIVEGKRVYQEDIDSILDKYNQVGESGLTNHERYILREVSRQMQ